MIQETVEDFLEDRDMRRSNIMIDWRLPWEGAEGWYWFSQGIQKVKDSLWVNHGEHLVPVFARSDWWTIDPSEHVVIDAALRGIQRNGFEKDRNLRTNVDVVRVALRGVVAQERFARDELYERLAQWDREEDECLVRIDELIEAGK
jgi:hypothetical protein